MVRIGSRDENLAYTVMSKPSRASLSAVERNGTSRSLLRRVSELVCRYGLILVSLQAFLQPRIDPSELGEGVVLDDVSIDPLREQIAGGRRTVRRSEGQKCTSCIAFSCDINDTTSIVMLEFIAAPSGSSRLRLGRHNRPGLFAGNIVHDGYVFAGSTSQCRVPGSCGVDGRQSIGIRKAYALRRSANR